MYPMKYKPILDIKSEKDFVGENWKEIELNNFKKILSAHSPQQIVTCYNKDIHKMRPLDEFHFWFGKNEKEFKKLLNYKNLTLYLKHKKSELRKIRHKIPLSTIQL